MPARSCFPVPRALNDTEAALLEPLGVAVHAVDMAPTVARILGVEPLEDASGDVLTEALPAVH